MSEVPSAPSTPGVRSPGARASAQRWSLGGITARLARLATPLRWSVRLGHARDVFEYAVHVAAQARLAQVAASLTFSSVLALVPLLAVILAVLTTFPMFTEFRDSLERDLPKGLLPVPYAQTILRYLSDFAAKAAGVGVAGVVFLGFSALSMILTVDRVLNDIWRVRRRRALAQRLLVYWALLSLGPVLLGLSLSLTSYVISLSDAHLERGNAAIRHAISLLSPVIAATVYTAMYALVPNRRVLWRHAVTGGVVTALTGELLSRGFAAYVIHGSILSIYGAFAALPVFLMWIWLSWLTFLFGAAIAATLPQLRLTRFTDMRRAGNRLVTAVAIVRLLHGARAAGGALRPLALGAIARSLRTDEQELDLLLAQLEELGYARRLARDGAVCDEWVLACDPLKQGLAPLFHRFAIDPDNSLLQREDLALADWLQPALDGPWLNTGLGQLSERAPQASSNRVPRTGT